jgi:SAM-dependent methyltransferase
VSRVAVRERRYARPVSETRSINFDRAADFYDATRDQGDEVTARTIELLEREFRDRGRALEIGVGTGAIALPLAAREVRLVGIDLSTAMMAKLVEKAGGRAPLPLLHADATRVPIRDGALGGAYARHVLHLISDWTAVVAELCRVVGDGVILIDVGGGPSGWMDLWEGMQPALGPEADPVGFDVVEQGTAALDEAFLASGGRLRVVEEIATRDDETVADALDAIRARTPSWTWRVADADLDRAVELGTAWAMERHGTLDVRLNEDARVRWRIYDVGP